MEFVSILVVVAIIAIAIYIRRKNKGTGSTAGGAPVRPEMPPETEIKIESVSNTSGSTSQTASPTNKSSKRSYNKRK